MMKLRKKVLGLAVAAAAVGGVSAVQAVELLPSNQGQALIYPYFTTLNGWQTFIHVTNTSGRTVIAKVRFRDAANSTDIYDGTLVLSPNDMWTASVEANGNNGGFRTVDNSCFVPNIPVNTWTEFSSPSREGYVEVIMMGVSAATVTPAQGTVSWNAQHVSGVPRDCGAVQNALADPATVATLAAAAGPGEFSATLADPTLNVLSGKYDLVNVGLEQSGAGRAVALGDFATAGSPYNTATGMWAQSTGEEEKHPTLAEGGDGLQALNTSLSHTAVTNEWVLNQNLGELSTWVVTFPTKRLTTDAVAAINTTQGTGNTIANNFSGCQVLGTTTIFNREEGRLVLASGGSGRELCNEVNVVNFKNASSDSSSVLGSNVGITVNVTGIAGIQAGWVQFALPNTNINTAPALALVSLPGFAAGATYAGEDYATNGLYTPAAAGAATYALDAVAPSAGRPVVGFGLTTRTTPSDAVLYEHAYQ